MTVFDRTMQNENKQKNILKSNNAAIVNSINAETLKQFPRIKIFMLPQARAAKYLFIFFFVLRQNQPNVKRTIPKANARIFSNLFEKKKKFPADCVTGLFFQKQKKKNQFMINMLL